MSDGDKTVKIPSHITVGELAGLLDQKVGVVITELMKNGVMATINDHLDNDTASIIAGELGFEVGKVEEPTALETVEKASSTKQGRATSASSGKDRPPVAAVMGHVDHGKTSLLDTIRGSTSASQEAGGITQHISAYHVTHNKRDLTLLDTPGHEAFASLRQHGAALTDVAVIVVAADDGVKPQTKEAVEFALKAGVHVVVAINKVDKPTADVNRTKQQLADIGLTAEDWGGDTVMVEVSAKANQGVDQLLDMIFLVADINELKADYSAPAEGIVIESHLATGRGPMATLLIEQGELKTQQFVVAGNTYAKIRSMEDENGESIKVAGPSRAVHISGFKAVPQFGDLFKAVKTEKEARRISQGHDHSSVTEPYSVKSISSAADVLANLNAATSHKSLPILIKADVRGSLESIKKSVEDLGNDEVSIKVVASGIGDINESDVIHAKTSNAMLIGFNVAIPPTAKRTASRDGVSIGLYQVIYELLDDLRSQLESMLPPEIIETEIGQLTIKGVFRTTRQRIVCGGEVNEGKVIPDTLARAKRGDKELAIVEVKSVQKGQSAAKEVVAGEMCGLELATEQKVVLEIDDRLELFKREERPRKLVSSTAK